MANLVDTVTQAGKFNTLAKAIQADDLAEMLQSPGPITVLAPTDEVFAKLPNGLMDEMLWDQAALQRVLIYHILQADARLEDLQKIDEAPTAEGSVVAVEHPNGQVKVNDTTVLEADILTDNGVIHAINTVLMPTLVESALEQKL
ncbi:fasciclin domain-containing protein [Leptodesmis sp.]|uniref:fasciclin domain-containing protein n=1 Tax=Leptodesmis sp. TaxID=3100501 RepID=UPI004053525B